MSKRIIFLSISLFLLIFGVAYAQSPTETPPTLHVFAVVDQLTLYIPQQTSLDGLQFAVIENGAETIKSLQDAFPSLQLVGNVAQAGTCFVYELSGSAPPLSDSCKGQVFKYSVAPADRFWYDAVSNRLVDVSVLQAGSFIATCPAGTPDCAVSWNGNPPTPQSTPTPADTVPLTLSYDPFSLRLFVPEAVSVAGLQFVIVDANGQQQVYALKDAFSDLQLTQGMAQANDCYLYNRNDSVTPTPSPDSCSGRAIAPDYVGSDGVFWYDWTQSKPRDFAVYDNGAFIGLCSANASPCTISWPTRASTPGTPAASPSPITPTATATSAAKGYPCDGIIVVNTSPGVGLNQVHVIAQSNSPNHPPAIQGSTVSIVGTQSLGSNRWYQIQYKDAQSNNDGGWIESQYITPSNSCPTT